MLPIEVAIESNPFPQLETTPPSYQFLSDKFVSDNSGNRRRVTKYVLHDDRPETCTQAVTAITTLLREKADLCAVFSTEDAYGLRGKIRKNHYLTINGSAVCLATERQFMERAVLQDKYFSETLLKRPVLCSRGHRFEYNRALHWISKKGEVCPVSPPEHFMSSELMEDEDVKRDIADYQKEVVEREAADTNLERLNQLQEGMGQLEMRLTHQRALLALRDIQLARLGSSTTTTTRVDQLLRDTKWRILKVGMQELKHSIASAEKSRKIKYACCKIPVVGLVAAVREFDRSQKVLGGLRIASGVFACVPALGTLFSIGIDVASAIGDNAVHYFRHRRVTFYVPSARVALGLNQAEDISQADLEVQELSPAENISRIVPELQDLNQIKNISQADVDEAYEKQRRALIEDKQGVECFEILEGAKRLLYTVHDLNADPTVDDRSLNSSRHNQTILVPEVYEILGLNQTKKISQEAVARAYLLKMMHADKENREYIEHIEWARRCIYTMHGWHE